MRFLFSGLGLFLGLLLSVRWLPAQAATNPAPVYPRALPVAPAELAPSAPPAPPPLVDGATIHWFGHGFVLITSSAGVRAAFDPFGPETVHYPTPVHVVADFVLVSHEAEDHAYAEQIFGNPLIFRSVTAIGLNRANGIPFHGVSLHRSADDNSLSDTAFTLKLNGVVFCYLGQITQPLNETEKEALGKVDVLFLPVGLQGLSVSDLNQVASDLHARMIIPINYKTVYSGDLPLRPLDEYLASSHLPRVEIAQPELTVSPATLPLTPTLYLLPSPK